MWQRDCPSLPIDDSIGVLQEFLTELADHIDVNEHHKPSVFTQACNDLCRFGFDHPDVFGTAKVLDCLFRALKYKPDHDDEDEGEPMLFFNRAQFSWKIKSGQSAGYGS